MLEMGKTGELCTNALRLEQCLDWFEPSPRMTFVVHLDGMREVDDVIEMMRYLTDDVGIDGMLVAPGYQYSQIDPALTMTRDEHEAKFREIRAAVRKHGYRWIASPIYQEFLTGERK